MKDCNHCMACVGGICRAEECHGSISGFFDSCNGSGSVSGGL